MFKNICIKTAVESIIFEYASKNPDIYEKHALEIIDIINQLTKRRKLCTLYESKGIFDILYASAYLYKIFYQDNLISTLFLLREKTATIFNEHNVDLETQLRIFQMCETFMGEDSLTEFLIPAKGYPDDIFADAIYIYETFVSDKVGANNEKVVIKTKEKQS